MQTIPHRELRNRSAEILRRVREGESYTVRIPGAVLLEKVALVCVAGPLHISVWKV